MKRYAKNPAPEEVEVLDNPAEFVLQNPTSKKNSNTMAKRKRDSKGRFKSKRTNPMDNADEFLDTGKNLFMQYGLAALASTGTVKGAEYLLGQVPNIPSWAREWGMIALPGMGGILLSMMTDSRNAIYQGVAGGMVLASANGLSDKLIKGESPNGMSDGSKALEPGDYIVKADGFLYDQEGNKIARIDAEGMKAKQAAMPKTQPQKTMPKNDNASGTFGKNDSHLLQGAGNYEGGETFNP